MVKPTDNVALGVKRTRITIPGLLYSVCLDTVLVLQF